MTTTHHSQAQWEDRDKERDPLAVMADVVSGFEHFIVKARNSESRGLKYRANLLWVHALAALSMGPLFVATGVEGMRYNPNFTFLLKLPGAPISVGMMLGWGGLVLGLGCVLGARRLEIAGLLCLALFYLTLALSFATASIAYYTDGQAGPRPAIYSPILYMHMTIIMAVHMATLFRASWKSRLDEIVR